MSVSDQWALAGVENPAISWFHAWRSNLACILAPVEDPSAWASLDARERRYLTRRPTKRTRLEFITSRMAVKLLARTRYGNRCHHYRIDHDGIGAPRLLCMGAISRATVSIAHADGWGGAMLGQHPIGFDLEFCDPANRDISRYLGCDAEWKKLGLVFSAADEDSGTAATAMLVIKESVLKAMRQPITIPREQVMLKAIRPMADMPGGGDFSAISSCLRHSFSGRIFKLGRLMVGLSAMDGKAPQRTFQ